MLVISSTECATSQSHLEPTSREWLGSVAISNKVSPREISISLEVGDKGMRSPQGASCSPSICQLLRLAVSGMVGRQGLLCSGDVPEWQVKDPGRKSLKPWVDLTAPSWVSARGAGTQPKLPVPRVRTPSNPQDSMCKDPGHLFPWNEMALEHMTQQ